MKNLVKRIKDECYIVKFLWNNGWFVSIVNLVRIKNE